MTSRDRHADLIITSARIWDGGDAGTEAVAIAGGKVLSTGTNRQILELGTDATRIIDVGGRRLIPGLIDSHIHLVRAGRTWTSEVRWDFVASLRDGLAAIAARTEDMDSARWTAVVGGWHPGQFEEGRAPTTADLDEAAPRHPVFVQRNYVEAILNTRALDEMGWGKEHPEGVVADPGRLAALRARIRGERMEESTREMLRHLNGLGLTGAIDAGGFGMTLESYAPFLAVMSDDEPGFRARLLVGATTPGSEPEDFARWMQAVRPGQGDDIVRYLGAGELLLYGAHDLEGLAPKDSTGQVDALSELSRALIERDWPIHVHAILDTSVVAVLDAWDRLDTSRLAELRSAICHADQVSESSLGRIAEMGIGVTAQAGMAFRGLDSSATWTDDQITKAPRLRTMLEMGIPVAVGSDGTVAASHNPWTTISWLVTGRNVDGSPSREDDQLLTVDEALRLHTVAGAWFSFEEETRGNLRPGSHADLAVLSADPITISAESLYTIESVLTVVAGTVAHSTLQDGKVGT